MVADKRKKDTRGTSLRVSMRAVDEQGGRRDDESIASALERDLLTREVGHPEDYNDVIKILNKDESLIKKANESLKRLDPCDDRRSLLLELVRSKKSYL